MLKRLKVLLALAVLVILVLVLFSSASENPFSGFISGEIKSQQTNLIFLENQSIKLKPAGILPRLSQFWISGKANGEFIAVTLSDGKRELLVYEKRERTLTPAFGLITASSVFGTGEGKAFELVKDERTAFSPQQPEHTTRQEKNFFYSCIQTCTIPQDFYNSNGYELRVYLSPDATLEIYEFSYSFASD
ncbi:MAG: hypothetical protein QXU88_01610 [Candidatus Woesearchaeota archaeon]